MDNTQESKEIALHYFKTLVDVVRESFIILSADLRIVSANQVFYDTFKVTHAETEGFLFYELGNGQWNIPELKKLLEEILPEKKVVRDFEVTHDFETIGQKTILLNARQIDSVQLIVLAMEDISVRKNLEVQQASHSSELEKIVKERTAELEKQIAELKELNKTMVGRELKMVELKEEVERLKKP